MIFRRVVYFVQTVVTAHVSGQTFIPLCVNKEL